MPEKQLAEYGIPAFRYQGSGEVTIIAESRAFPSSVEFEIRQTAEGAIVAHCSGRDDNLGISWQLGGRKTFVGSVSRPKGHIELEGELLVVHQVLSSEQSLDLQFLAPKAVYRRDISRPAASARFALVNFTFEGQPAAPWAPISFDVNGLSLTISRIQPGYDERVKQISFQGGLAQTAWLEIRPLEGLPFSIEEVEKFVDRLLTPTSLALGTKVGWLYHEAFDRRGRLIQRVHHPPIIRGFSNTVVSYGWTSTVADVVLAWWDKVSTQDLDEGRFAVLVDHYHDAGARGTFMESKALSAATLLDVLASQHAVEAGSEYIIPDAEWKTVFERNVKAAVKAVLADRPNVTKDQCNEVADNITGAHRRSFRKRLRALLEKVQFGGEKKAKEALINDLITVRNVVVHEGRFHSAQRSDWTTEYHLLLAACRYILLKLAGHAEPPLEQVLLSRDVHPGH